MLPDQVRLEHLLERLHELESRPVPAHQRAIVEIGLTSLRDAIAELSHRLHDTDYWQTAPVRVEHDLRRRR